MNLKKHLLTVSIFSSIISTSAFSQGRFGIANDGGAYSSVFYHAMTSSLQYSEVLNDNGYTTVTGQIDLSCLKLEAEGIAPTFQCYAKGNNQLVGFAEMALINESYEGMSNVLTTILDTIQAPNTVTTGGDIVPWTKTVYKFSGTVTCIKGQYCIEQQ